MALYDSISMQQVFARIEACTDSYQRHPLWQHLQAGQGAQSALQKLRCFAPAISHFILGFRDFNDFVAPYAAPQSALEMAINQHAIEDASHFRLFIEEWEKLGGDALLDLYASQIPALPGADQREESADTMASLQAARRALPSISTRTLSFLWGDAANRHNRKLLHSYARLVHVLGQDAVVRFAIIEAGEATGLVMFGATAALAQEAYPQQPGAMRYFGDYHLALETGHLVNQDTAQIQQTIACACEADAAFRDLNLSQEQFAQCCHAVEQTFAIFTEWLDGIQDLMQRVQPELWRAA
ncbi:hypothetical protein V8J88_17160 [Massilia sp. W12]|uniref:hypothetical protein n=1 Tax=Massilia sp. W12 TaxID=3126507 RepID=UPI0030D268A8